MSDGLLIVGGGYAASQLAASVRQLGYSEKIRIVSSERELPYQRPPLSKGFLTGTVPEDRLKLRPEAFYVENNIDLILNTEVADIDITNASIGTRDGCRFRYSHLALTMGSRPRPLEIPGAHLNGIYHLSSIDDARALVSGMQDANSVVIIGGGFIGLEVASSARKLGKKVEVIESSRRVLGRSVAAEVAQFISALHASNGVKIQTERTIREFVGSDGRVTHVECSDGSRIPADIVVVGIGAVPNIEVAKAAGLGCLNGIVVDEFAKTDASNIVAAGDCTNHFSVHAGCQLRLESVQNAIDQAKTAAATVAGFKKPYTATPWFWSDQFECKLQIAGISAGHDSVVVRRKTSSKGDALVALYFRADMLIAVDAVDAAADHMAARKLLARPLSVPKNELKSCGFDIVAYAKK